MPKITRQSAVERALSCSTWDAVNNPRNWRSMDPPPPVSREISLTVRWLWSLFSWLNNSDSIVSILCRRFHQYAHCVCRCPDACRLFRTSPAACWCCSSSLIFVQKLWYKLPSVVTFTFIHTFNWNFNFVFLLTGVKVGAFATCIQSQNSRYFRCRY